MKNQNLKDWIFKLGQTLGSGIREAVMRVVDVDLDANVNRGEDTDSALGKWRKQLRIVFCTVFLLFAFYIGGVASILSNPYRYGGSLGLFHAIGIGLTTKTGVIIAVLVFLIVLCFVAYIKFMSRKRLDEDDRNFTFSRKGSYGTSRLEQPREYKKYLDVVDSALETDGIIIGKTLDGKHVVAIPKDSPYNRNICVCGSQGTAKSVAFARNMIIQCAVRGESFVVMDPKSELFEDTVYYLKKHGYEVEQWNLINRWNSNGWDVLQEIVGDEELEYVDVLCSTIIQNTADTKNAGDFFDKIETVLLKALILYVVKEYPEEERTLGNVYNMILQETAESLDAKFSSLPATHPAYGPYNLFSKSPTNKGNAILGLGSRLSIFQTEVVQKMTGYKEIDMESIAQRKVAVYCIASDSNTTYNMLNALFISMLFIKIMSYADRQKSRKCDIPVHIILDEFPNIGVIDAFKQKEATARSRDIGIDILFQNVPQLMNRYPDGVWEELIGGCDFRLILGCNETTTSEYFSKLTGTSTINVDTERRNLKTIRLTNYTPEMAQSSGLGQRATLFEDEIRRLDPDELLFFVRGKQPIKLKKFKFYEHPEALGFRQIKAHEIIPRWRDDVSKEEKEWNSLDSIVERSDDNSEIFVVQDSEKYGPQRSRLLDELHCMQKKYENEGVFPNGHLFFDDFGLDYNSGNKTSVSNCEPVLNDKENPEPVNVHVNSPGNTEKVNQDNHSSEMDVNSMNEILEGYSPDFSMEDDLGITPEEIPEIGEDLWKDSEIDPISSDDFLEGEQNEENGCNEECDSQDQKTKDNSSLPSKRKVSGLDLEGLE